MSVNFGVDPPTPEPTPWNSTTDVPWYYWVGICVGAPIALIIFYLHRNQKFCCKYNPEGVEDRLQFLATGGLALFFLIKMFAGHQYFQSLWEKAESDPTLQIFKYHAFAALLTTVTRILLSVV